MALGFPLPCPRCHVRVMCEVGPEGGAKGNERNCCNCAPKRLQVSVNDEAGYIATCKTFALDCADNAWLGVVAIDGTNYDLKFYFEKDDDGDCWFYLESAALDLENGSGDTRLRVAVPGDWQIDRAAREAICADPAFTFDAVAIPGVGDVTISTQEADYQTINPRHLKRCEPIDPAYCPDGVSCLDCNCFCRCVCITFQDADETFTERICFDDYTESWSITTAAMDTLTISIGCDSETGESRLMLTDPYNGVTRTVAANCPDIIGTWEFTKPDTSPVTVSITCDTCGECTGGDPDACGCPDGIPSLLYATLSPGTDPGGPDPNPTPCTGATGSVTLRWDSANAYWQGTGRPFAGCSTLVYMRMTCAGAGLMKLEIGDSWAALSDAGTVAVTCDPFSGEWVGLTLLIATDACCGEVGTTANYHIFNVTVTE